MSLTIASGYTQALNHHKLRVGMVAEKFQKNIDQITDRHTSVTMDPERLLGLGKLGIIVQVRDEEARPLPSS
ncbi:hypothetical protein EJ03DRAFT_325273 [Teratosphaeria nubilosa]|uniref:Uncharacterized protein n=1 Tax=Teratosphaeria nubilosa TaxID=161662 RepID=A0A6G1LFG1_9PEZI|nr:hypothetical protein EJ03DRAFT_325273 [Teratosphaeria nubilosa]